MKIRHINRLQSCGGMRRFAHASRMQILGKGIRGARHHDGLYCSYCAIELWSAARKEQISYWDLIEQIEDLTEESF